MNLFIWKSQSVFVADSSEVLFFTGSREISLLYYRLQHKFWMTKKLLELYKSKILNLFVKWLNMLKLYAFRMTWFSKNISRTRLTLNATTMFKHVQNRNITSLSFTRSTNPRLRSEPRCCVTGVEIISLPPSISLQHSVTDIFRCSPLWSGPFNASVRDSASCLKCRVESQMWEISNLTSILILR